MSKGFSGCWFLTWFLTSSRHASSCVSQWKWVFYLVSGLRGASTKDKFGVHFLRVESIPIEVRTSCRHLGEGSVSKWFMRSGSGTIVTLPVAEVVRESPAKVAFGPTHSFSIENLKFTLIALIMTLAVRSHDSWADFGCRHPLSFNIMLLGMPDSNSLV